LAGRNDDSLTYVSDDSGSPSIVSGSSLTWHISALGFLERWEMRVLVRLPDAAVGTRYLVRVALASAGQETNPADNTATVEIVIARQMLLPLIAQ
jgi:hypothetical protein